MLVEQFDQLCEVGKRPGETVDLIHDDDVDLPGANLVEQRLKGRAVQRGAGQPAVIEMGGNQRPAFMRLALDIGFTGFALGVERVEGQIEIMLGRFARVDRAALALWRDLFHGARSKAQPARTEDRRPPARATAFWSSDDLTTSGCFGSSFDRSPKNRGPFQFVPA